MNLVDLLATLKNEVLRVHGALLIKPQVLAAVGGILLGSGIGHGLGQSAGHERGLTEQLEVREALLAELDLQAAINRQRGVSIKTAEATIAALTDTLGSEQKKLQGKERELELYRRIEAGGLKRGLHVDDVQLVDTDTGPAMQVTLLQVGGSSQLAGFMAVSLIGADLPNAEDNRLEVAALDNASAVPYDFRFMTQVAVPLPRELAAPSGPGERPMWLAGLDLLEIDLISENSDGKRTRVTVPADRMIVGLEQ